MTVVEILKAAKEKLTEPRVWVNHTPAGEDNCECIVTACANVDTAGYNWDDAANILDLLARRQGFKSETGIYRPAAQWNDAPNRTIEEVLALFDQAILLAESAP